MAEFSSDVYVLNVPFHLLLNITSIIEFSGGPVVELYVRVQYVTLTSTHCVCVCVCVCVCCPPSYLSVFVAGLLLKRECLWSNLLIITTLIPVTL